MSTRLAREYARYLASGGQDPQEAWMSSYGSIIPPTPRGMRTAVQDLASILPRQHGPYRCAEHDECRRHPRMAAECYATNPNGRLPDIYQHIGEAAIWGGRLSGRLRVGVESAWIALVNALRQLPPVNPPPAPHPLHLHPMQAGPFSIHPVYAGEIDGDGSYGSYARVLRARPAERFRCQFGDPNIRGGRFRTIDITVDAGPPPPPLKTADYWHPADINRAAAEMFP